MVSNGLSCLVFNAQSICNKGTLLMEHIIDHDAGVLFLTETWLKSKKNNVTAMFEEYGYVLHHNIRKNRAKQLGGGVGILVKKCANAKPIMVTQFQSFEHCVVKLCLQNTKWMTFISIYRIDDEPMTLFFSEFTELLEILTATNGKFIIAGDINIHCDYVNSCHTTQLNELLSTFNLTQIIDSPTHRAGHTLDVVITQLEDTEITGTKVSNISLGDHFLISFIINCSILKSYFRNITYRNMKQVNYEIFSEELVDSLESISITDDIGKTINEYNTKLASLMDRHAPKITKKVKIVKSAPWFDTEYRELRKQRRKAEKRYKRTGEPCDKEAFKHLRKQTTVFALQKKREYFTSQINNAKNKPKVLFNVVHTLMDKKQDSVLPTANSDSELANKFLYYFKDKISKIRKSFPAKVASLSSAPLSENIKLLDVFEPATEDEIRAIIISYGVSCSPEDPVHAKLLSANTDILIPYWLEIVNLSLATGSMDCLKSAVISPLLKELDDFIDSEIFKNYRPVSNLTFLSKLIERCVASRLDKHMKDNHLESKHQYGYKKGHSTEMLLVNVVDNLLTAFDNKFATVLLLLDLSAAFDTVDQGKLLDILNYEIGISGVAYKWFESFLIGRSQKVKINNSYSESELLDFGCIQGSVLGPRLFNIYIRSFYLFVQNLTFEVDGFADDHQLYKQFIPVFQIKVLGAAINECLREVSTWMNTYFLRLNKSKTKILVLAPPSVMSSISIHGTFMENGVIRFVDCAKNLGIWLDYNLTFKTQVHKVVSSCFMILREI